MRGQFTCAILQALCMMTLDGCANATQLRGHFFDADNNLHLVMEARSAADNLMERLEKEGPMSEHEACTQVGGAHASAVMRSTCGLAHGPLEHEIRMRTSAGCRRRPHVET